MDNIRYHDHDITIIYDKTGDRYKKGKGLIVFSDGVLIAEAENLHKVTGDLESANYK